MTKPDPWTEWTTEQMRSYRAAHDQAEDTDGSLADLWAAPLCALIVLGTLGLVLLW
ncbi:hypothetical protein ACIRBX_12155 [Kitasatospora sp. NPDC096147]|uniref:hypothetical protein n=1 Tax=Kitasatospora sp. NPDC096147 TaxID=3364093 RepID=UPI00382BF025